MGDSETVVAQTSTVMGYTAEGHAPAAYAGVGSAVPEAAGAYAAGTVGEVAVPMAMDNPGYAVAGNEGNLYGTDLNSGVQGSQVGVTYETKPEGMTDTTGHPAGSENTTTEALQTANYGSANGNIGAEGGSVPTTENGNVEQQHTDGSAPSMSAEEERLWNIVRANSLDFNAWTALIEETEKVAENDISRIRKVYDAFLAEFPLCYGYWKKYADHEARFGLIDKVVEVYERAVQGVTYSVDIWLHYCLFAASTYGDPETIRRLFERGLAYVGTDYLSYPLWDRYIEYEYSQQDWGRLAMIYTRILENPIQQLDRYFNSFKELARSRPLSELKSAEEAATGAADASSESQGKVTEGEVRTDDSEQSTKTESAGSTEAEELEKYISIREEMYKKAKEFDSKIIDFETAIRRPYFHVRPLNDAELENWHNYLDFIEREADFSKLSNVCCVICFLTVG